MTQLWEPCEDCGREPCYLELGNRCERCGGQPSRREHQINPLNNDLAGTIYNDEVPDEHDDR